MNRLEMIQEVYGNIEFKQEDLLKLSRLIWITKKVDKWLKEH